MKKLKNKFYEKSLQQGGITLIALVVTIIVLLILAGVSLNLVAGSNGILNRATIAVNETKMAQLREALELSNAEILMDQYAEGEYVMDLYDYIKEKCEENLDRTVEASDGKYWLDEEGELHYTSKSSKIDAKLEKGKNGNPAIKDTKEDDELEDTNKDVAYKVEHYQMTMDGTYPTSATTVENKTGTAGASITVANLAKTYEGFTYRYGQVGGSNATTTTVAADGSRVIKLYYERNQYTITYDSNGGSDCEATTAYYGANISLPTPTVPNDRFTGFNGWYTTASGGTKRTYTTMPAKNETVYAQYTEVTGVGTSIMKGAWYGDAVNYGDVNGCNNWKVFSNDGNNIYLIAGDMVTGSTLSLTEKVSTNGDKVYASDGSNSHTTLANWMTTTNNWSSFVNTTYADQATGGPTIEQLITSANGRLGTSYTIDSIVSQILEDALYVIGKPWWLASANSVAAHQWDVYETGEVHWSPAYGDNYCGVRPLVCLKSDVKMTWNGSSWDLSI